MTKKTQIPSAKAPPTRQSEPSYAEAIRESKTREAAQKPYRKQFVKCGTLDKLAALLAKNKSTFDSVPWLSWICEGPGEDKKWATTRGKPDAKKQKALVKIIGDLIKGGAELALVDEEGRLEPHALARLLQLDELTAAQRVTLLELAIEHGADPADRLAYPLWASENGPFSGYEVTKSALDVALADDEHPQFLAAIVPHASRGVLEDARLRHVIDNLRNRPEHWLDRFTSLVDSAGKLDRIVTKLDSTSSAALVHFLCEAEVRVEYLDRVIDRVDLDLPLPAPLTTLVSIAWGITPSMKVPAGSTPLDMVDAILGFVKRAEAANAKKPDKSFRADNAATIRQLAEQKRERLVARGAKKGDAAAIELPPVLAETAKQLLRLAKLLGVDDAPIRDAIAGVDTDGMGPWGFLRAIVPAFESELVSPKLDAPPLVQLLTAFTTERWSNELRKSRLPAARRASAELAIEFHTDDDASLLAVKAGGTTQIWRLASDEVTVVAPSVPAYLEREIDRWQDA